MTQIVTNRRGDEQMSCAVNKAQATIFDRTLALDIMEAFIYSTAQGPCCSLLRDKSLASMRA